MEGQVRSGQQNKASKEGNSRVEHRGSETLSMSEGYSVSVSRPVDGRRWEQIRITKESQLAEGTHILPSTDRGSVRTEKWRE